MCTLPSVGYNPPILGTRPQPRGSKEAEFVLRYKKLEIVADAVHLIFPWGSLVAIFWLLHLMVDQLAGRVTMAQLGMSFMGSIRVPDAVLLVFGGSAGGWAFRERNLRRKKIAEMSDHIQHLESLVDSNRTTSGLTRRGTTRPEDKI
jgi:hypothetical protein